MNKEVIYNVIVKEPQWSILNRIYSVVMLISILISILPLFFRDEYEIFIYTEYFSVSLFIMDYILRWYVSDYTLKKGFLSYFIHPFTPMAIIDLLSILPSFVCFNHIFVLGRVLRLFRILRMTKLLRYSKRLSAFFYVIRKEKKVLWAVLGISIFYIFFTALLMFNIEPRYNPETGEETFETFFDALYWATVTLTTVGYGDLCPVTEFGRLVSMLSSIFGVAIIALPSGVITASYLDEIRKMHREHDEGNEVDD